MLLTSVIAVLLIALVMMITGFTVESAPVPGHGWTQGFSRAPQYMTGSPVGSLHRIWHGKHPCPPWVVLK